MSSPQSPSLATCAAAARMLAESPEFLRAWSKPDGERDGAHVQAIRRIAEALHAAAGELAKAHPEISERELVHVVLAEAGSWHVFASQFSGVVPESCLSTAPESARKAIVELAHAVAVENAEALRKAAIHRGGLVLQAWQSGGVS